MIIGLTGNIAAGKSTVSRRLAQLGADVIDADLIARRVVEPQSPGARQIAEAFGQEYFSNGQLDRKKLGALVFSNPEARKRLEAITHPLIFEQVEKRLKTSQADIKILDAPLLFEAGMDQLCDRVWLVTADAGLRQRRIVQRDGLTEAEALQRMNAQMSQEEKAQRADATIENNGSQEELERRVDALIQEVRRDVD